MTVGNLRFWIGRLRFSPSVAGAKSKPPRRHNSDLLTRMCRCHAAQVQRRIGRGPDGSMQSGRDEFSAGAHDVSGRVDVTPSEPARRGDVHATSDRPLDHLKYPAEFVL